MSHHGVTVEDAREIVVVDDDAGMSKAIERLLRTWGWPARSFSSAETFLGWGNAGKASFLVIDIQLPGMSGFELQQHLVDSGIHPLVAFITGDDHPSLRARAERAGALAFLVKPFAGHLLTDVIRRHVPAP